MHVLTEPVAPAGGVAGAHAALLARLARTIDELLTPRVPVDRPVALLDFPQTPNVGDSVIWISAVTLLERRGIRPCYTCSNRSYARRVLARKIGSGTILLSGGGNLGDLYPSHQELREAVVRDFPGNRIIQLPQTIHFDSATALERARRVFDAHPDFTLMVRDRRSLEVARGAFRASSLLCPDVAFALGPRPRPTPRVPVVWLARSDKERRDATVIATPPGVRRSDWLLDDRTWWSFLNRQLKRIARRWPATRELQSVLSWTYRPLAGERMARGSRILGAGRVVVTNRLHGHILCLLLGIPHVLLDNRYGKVRGFYEAWTNESPLVEWADDEGCALARARALAADLARR